MAGERQSKTRQRTGDETCAICLTPIVLRNWPSAERRCDKCAGTHKVYLSFHKRGAGWICSFLELDAKTPVGRVREFGTPNKIRDLIARTPTRQDQAAKQSFEYGIENGRGGLFLELTAEQYWKLKT